MNNKDIVLEKALSIAARTKLLLHFPLKDPILNKSIIVLCNEIEELQKLNGGHFKLKEEYTDERSETNSRDSKSNQPVLEHVS
jgi:hypothetical protein